MILLGITAGRYARNILIVYREIIVVGTTNKAKIIRVTTQVTTPAIIQAHRRMQQVAPHAVRDGRVNYLKLLRYKRTLRKFSD